jgi:hypothetical protein
MGRWPTLVHRGSMRRQDRPDDVLGGRLAERRPHRLGLADRDDDARHRLTGRCKQSTRGRRAFVGSRCLSSLTVVAPGHARHRNRRALASGGTPRHDQANPHGPRPRGLIRWRRRRLQHTGQHRGAVDLAPEHAGVQPGRLGGAPLGRAERLLAPRSRKRPGSQDPGRFFVARAIAGRRRRCVRLAASGSRRPARSDGFGSPCNARAIFPAVRRGRLQRIDADAADRLRRCREETLRTRGDRGPRSLQVTTRGGRQAMRRWARR